MKRPKSRAMVYTVWNRKFGLVDRRGRTIITPRFDRIGGNFDNWTCAGIGEREGFIDTRGRWIGRPRFEMTCMPTDGLGAVQLRRKMGYVNRRGKLIIGTKFDHAGDFSEGFAPVMVGRKWGFINRKGRLVTRLFFDHAFEFSEGLARVVIGDEYSFLNRRMEQVIGPLSVKVFHYFSEGRVAFWLGNKLGYMDRRGRVVIPAKFDRGLSFSQGLAWVLVDGRWGCIRRDGKYAIRPHLPGIRNWRRSLFTCPRDFSEGLCAVPIKRKWGFVNRSGQVVIPARFSQAYSFSGGLANVWVMAGGANKHALVDRRGRTVWQQP